MKPTKVTPKIIKRMEIIHELQSKHIHQSQTNQRIRLKPKTKTEKKKHYELLIKEIPETHFNVISQHIRGRLLTKLPDYSTKTISDITQDIMYNIIKYGLTFSQWKEYSHSTETPWIQTDILNQLFENYRENEIIQRCYFRSIIIKTLQNMINGNFTYFHSFFDGSNGINEWNAKVDCELLKEIVLKGNEMYSEYLKNSLIKDYIEERFGTSNPTNQKNLLKMRISFLTKYCNNFYKPLSCE